MEKEAELSFEAETLPHNWKGESRTFLPLNQNVTYFSTTKESQHKMYDLLRFSVIMLSFRQVVKTNSCVSAHASKKCTIQTKAVGSRSTFLPQNFTNGCFWQFIVHDSYISLHVITVDNSLYVWHLKIFC